MYSYFSSEVLIPQSHPYSWNQLLPNACECWYFDYFPWINTNVLNNMHLECESFPRGFIPLFRIHQRNHYLATVVSQMYCLNNKTRKLNYSWSTGCRMDVGLAGMKTTWVSIRGFGSPGTVIFQKGLFFPEKQVSWVGLKYSANRCTASSRLCWSIYREAE